MRPNLGYLICNPKSLASALAIIIKAPCCG
jgi:hypothetical protein